MTTVKRRNQSPAPLVETRHDLDSRAEVELERLVAKARHLQSRNMLKLPEVQKRIPKCKSGIWKDVSDGVFVRPVRIGLRAVAWLEHEVDIWLEATIFNSRSVQPIDIKQLVSRLVDLHRAE